MKENKLAAPTWVNEEQKTTKNLLWYTGMKNKGKVSKTYFFPAQKNSSFCA